MDAAAKLQFLSCSQLFSHIFAFFLMSTEQTFSKGRSPQNLSQVIPGTLYCVMFVNSVILYVWWEIIALSVLSSQWFSLSILSAIHTDLQDFLAVFHRQLLMSSSGGISELCHLQRSDFSHMMYEHSFQPRPQLGAQGDFPGNLHSLWEISICYYLGLLFLSCW